MYANVLKEREGAVVELQHLLELLLVKESISILGMGIVIISTTIQSAPMMAEITVDLMQIQNTAQNANTLNEGKVQVTISQQHYLKDEKNKGKSLLGGYYPQLYQLCICNQKSAHNLNIQLSNHPKQAVLRILPTICLASTVDINT